MANSSARTAAACRPSTPPASFDADPLGALFGALLRSATDAVAVVAVRGADRGELVSMAAERLAAVSCNPPILLWSMSRRAKGIEALFAAKEVTIYMLVSSGRVAPFTDTPMVVECRPFARHDLGDRVIFLGDVMSFNGERASRRAEIHLYRQSAAPAGLKTLSLEVALCRLAGDSIRQTALHLGVSPSTVRYHLAALTGRPSLHPPIRRAKPHLARSRTT